MKLTAMAYNRRILLVLLCFLQSTFLAAKGLDELKPEAAPASDKETAEGTETAAPANAAEAKEAAPAEETPKLTFAREGASFLNDKGFLEVSYGIVRASASEGDWRASGMTDLTFKYKLRETSWSLLALARYAPFDVTVYEDQVGYRGTVNAYYLGAESRFIFQKSWYANASAEVGLMSVYLYDITDIGTDSDLEKNGAGFTVGLGAGRQLWDFLWIGPKMHLGFGRFTTFQFSVASALMF